MKPDNVIQPGTLIEFRESTRLRAPWLRGELVSDDGRRRVVLDADGVEHNLPASRVKVRAEATSTRRACAPLPIAEEARTFTTERRTREPDTHASADEVAFDITGAGDQTERSPFARAAEEEPTPARRRRSAPIVRPSIEAILRSPPLRDPEYVAFVRTLPCAICGAPPPSDPSHFGTRGMSQKTDDTRLLPSCREDHDYWHKNGRVWLGGRELSRVESERVLLAAQVDALTAWRKRELLFDARRSE